MDATGLFYGHFFEKLLRKEIDFIEDDIKCLFCTNEYTPDIDNHVFVSDIFGEVEAPDYPEGGFSLTNKTISYENGITTLDADDIELKNVAINNVRYVIVYKNTGVKETSILIGYYDLGEEIGVTKGDFHIIWDEGGIFHNRING